MSTPINAVYNGTFVTDAAASTVILPLPAGATELEIIDDTGYFAHGATITKAKGYAALPAGCADVWTGSGASPNVMTLTQKVTAGFTFFDDSGLSTTGAAITTAAGITNAAPPVVTSGTLPPVGSVVRLINTTTAQQLAGMDYTVTVSGAGTFTLGYVATAPGSAATANTYRQLPFQGTPVSGNVLTASPFAPNPRFYPRLRYITGITQAVNAVVSLSVAHQYKVGEKVRIRVPNGWGMREIDNYLATIVAVSYGTVANNSNTITLDIDSSAFTAFAYPTSAVAAAGVDFPMVTPVGEAAVNTIALPVGNSLDDRTRNVSCRGVIIDGSLLVASHNYSWIAKKGLTI